MRRYIKTRRERARKKYLVITNKVLRLCKVCYYHYCIQFPPLQTYLLDVQKNIEDFQLELSPIDNPRNRVTENKRIS